MKFFKEMRNDIIGEFNEINPAMFAAIFLLCTQGLICLIITISVIVGY
jgi:hypothetical protein